MAFYTTGQLSETAVFLFCVCVIAGVCVCECYCCCCVVAVALRCCGASAVALCAQHAHDVWNAYVLSLIGHRKLHQLHCPDGRFPGWIQRSACECGFVVPVFGVVGERFHLPRDALTPSLAVACLASGRCVLVA